MTAEAAKAPQTAALIEARNLHRIYTQGAISVKALQGVDLDVVPGEFTALVGPSGSGKSTLLNVVGGLDAPSQGEVKVAGQPIVGLSRSEAAEFRLHNVGFVFQAYNLLPVLSVYENAEYTLMLQGVDKAERLERVRPVLERVGLGGLEKRRPHELSGGQQQRVAVVRAIVSRPAIVLADEPTANLDSETSSSLMGLLEELNKEDGITFVLASHDTLVMERAKRVVHLKDGLIDHETRRDSA